MCDKNSDCTGGQTCVNGICQGGSNPPTVPVVPPISEEENEIENDKEG